MIGAGRCGGLCVAMALLGLVATPPCRADAPPRDDVEAEAGALDYLRAAVAFETRELHAEVRGDLVISWLVGSFFAPLGGHVWAPALFYRTAPSGEPRTLALVLGTIGIAAGYTNLLLLPCNLLPVLCLPFAMIPYVGWFGWPILTFGWQGCMLVVHAGVCAAAQAFNWYVLPRAISFAWSDAYAAEEHTR